MLSGYLSRFNQKKRLSILSLSCLYFLGREGRWISTAACLYVQRGLLISPWILPGSLLDALATCLQKRRARLSQKQKLSWIHPFVLLLKIGSILNAERGRNYIPADRTCHLGLVIRRVSWLMHVGWWVEQCNSSRTEDGRISRWGVCAWSDHEGLWQDLLESKSNDRASKTRLAMHAHVHGRIWEKRGLSALYG